jgi:hypothetical protein
VHFLRSTAGWVRQTWLAWARASSRSRDSPNADALGVSPVRWRPQSEAPLPCRLQAAPIGVPGCLVCVAKPRLCGKNKAARVLRVNSALPVSDLLPPSTREFRGSGVPCWLLGPGRVSRESIRPCTRGGPCCLLGVVAAIAAAQSGGLRDRRPGDRPFNRTSPSLEAKASRIGSPTIEEELKEPTNRSVQAAARCGSKDLRTGLRYREECARWWGRACSSSRRP